MNAIWSVRTNEVYSSIEHRKSTSVQSSVDVEKPTIHHGSRDGLTSQINERQLLRKIDFRVVPVLCILYLLAFLDRSVACYI